MQTELRKLRIAYLSASDPRDKRAWSGSLYNIYSTLQDHVGTVDILGPYSPKFPVFIGKVLHFFSQLFFKKRYDYKRSTAVSKAYGHYFDKKLKESNYDLIVAPAASSEIAYLKTKIPIVYISDSTLKASLNYHKALSSLTKSSEKQSLETEKRALQKSTIAALTSPWAINSAVNDFEIEKNKLLLLPFGANFANPPEKQTAINKQKGEICKLLFVGVSWENKGGEIAFNTLINLLNSGIKAELTICGCIPPEKFKHDKITVIPFLNKAIKEEEQKLYHLFEEASFLILPTRFEAYGLVFCEASAYGVPSLATDTGGVSGVIKEGKNGFLFPHKDTGEGYAKKIIELWNDEAQYKALSLSCRTEYDERLNWESWATKLKEKLQQLSI